MSSLTHAARPLWAVFLTMCLASTASTQECLGLHQPTGRRTLEMTSAFARDGITGPTTLSLGTAGKRWWILGELGSDAAAGRAAPTIDAFAGALGLHSTLGPISICGGVGVAKETLLGQSLLSSSIIVGGALPAFPLPLRPRLYSIARYEVIEYDAGNVVGGAATGFGVRLGVVSYPWRWLGIRGYGDFSGTDQQWGMSVSLAVPTRRAPRVVVQAPVEPVAPAPDTVGGPVIEEVIPPTPVVRADGDNDGVVDEEDLCPRTPPGTAVDGNGCALPPPDADGDGVTDAADACPNTPKGTPVTANGCAADTDGDGVIDAIDACPATPNGAVIDATGCPRVKLKIVLVGVNFRTNSAQLLPESIDPLREVAEALKADQSAIVEIAGHTDTDGSPERNLALSLARARTVRTFLIGRGVEGDRMIARGYGSTRPVTTNDTAEGKALNRRVEMSRID